MLKPVPNLCRLVGGVVVAASFVSSAAGQTLDWRRELSFQRAEVAQPLNSREMPDGGQLVVSQLYSGGSNGDLVVGRFAADGGQLWRRAQALRADVGLSRPCAGDPAGNVYIGGRSSLTGDWTVARLAATTGEPEWTQNLRLLVPAWVESQPRQIEISPSGNALVLLSDLEQSVLELDASTGNLVRLIRFAGSFIVLSNGDLVIKASPVRRISGVTGSTVWASPIALAYNSILIRTPDGKLIASAAGGLTRISIATGEVIWSVPYVGFAYPVRVACTDKHLVLAGLDMSQSKARAIAFDIVSPAILWNRLVEDLPAEVADFETVDAVRLRESGPVTVVGYRTEPNPLPIAVNLDRRTGATLQARASLQPGKPSEGGLAWANDHGVVAMLPPASGVRERLAIFEATTLQRSVTKLDPVFWTPSNDPRSIVPLADGGLIVAGYSSGLACFDPNGQVRWRREFLSRQVLAVGANADTAVVICSTESFGLDVSTGTVRWTWKIEPTYELGSSVAVLTDGTFVIQTSSGQRRLDPTLKVEVWKNALNSAVYSYGNVLIAASGSDIKRIYSSDGKTTWTTPISGVVGRPLFDGDQYLYVAGSIGPNVEVTKLDLATGFRMWTQNVPYNGQLIRIARAGDRLMVAGSNGSVVALESGTGAHAWTHEDPFLGGRAYGVMAMDGRQGRFTVLGVSGEQQGTQIVLSSYRASDGSSTAPVMHLESIDFNTEVRFVVAGPRGPQVVAWQTPKVFDYSWQTGRALVLGFRN